MTTILILSGVVLFGFGFIVGFGIRDIMASQKDIDNFNNEEHF